MYPPLFRSGNRFRRAQVFERNLGAPSYRDRWRAEFQRERRLADGSWGESTVVTPLPGQFSFRPEIAKGADAGLRDAAFNYLTDKSQQRQILQPDFFATKRSNFSPAMLVAEAAGVPLLAMSAWFNAVCVNESACVVEE